MVSETVILACADGFHMRPAQRFAKAMSGYSAEIKIVCGAKVINGKSIMELMAACMHSGARLTVTCSGDDEKEMLAKAAELLSETEEERHC